MKGIYIFEEAELKGVVTCASLSGVEHEFTQTLALGKRKPEVEVDLQADVDYDKIVTARCSKDDSYDFETGALIALMKMCGADKTEKALGEIFGSESREIIQRAFDAAQISVSKNEYEEKIRALENTRDLLTNKNNELIEEKKYLKEKLEKRKKLINSMYGIKALQATTEYETKVAENAELKQRVEKLEEENKLDKSTIKQLCQDYTRLKSKNDKLRKDIGNLGRLYNKLKLDYQKLQHGYIDTDMVFCGGICCDRQYKALVELFKRLRQEMVDAAYKEAYNTCITKREKMWEKIIRLHKVEHIVIEVKKEDVTTFLHELEDRIPEITWSSGCKIFEPNCLGVRPIKVLYNDIKSHDGVCFRLSIDSQLTYSANPNIPYYANLRKIPYLSPMRWDLFKKGRLIVRITADNVDDFLKECEKNCKIKLPEAYTEHVKNRMAYNHGFIKAFKDYWTNKGKLPVGKPSISYGPFHFMTPDDLVRNQNVHPDEYAAKKIVDWEDVK